MKRSFVVTASGYPKILKLARQFLNTVNQRKIKRSRRGTLLMTAFSGTLQKDGTFLIDVSMQRSKTLLVEDVIARTRKRFSIYEPKDIAKLFRACAKYRPKAEGAVQS